MVGNVSIMAHHDAELEGGGDHLIVKDFGTSKSPKSTRLRDNHWAPAALRPRRSATPSQARRRLRNAPSNGSGVSDVILDSLWRVPHDGYPK